MKIKCNQTKQRWEATATVNGAEVAKITFEPYGENLIVHNVIGLWNHVAFKLYRTIFKLLRDGFRKQGFKLMCASSRYVDDLGMREKYWRLAGFKVFTDTVVEGQKLRVAVMEV